MTAPYRQLTQSQRYQIEAGLASDMSLSRIAKQIGAHPSTVSREVRRSSNGGPLYLHLRQRRRLYREGYGSHDRRGQLRNRVSISERPAEVETRERIGDWEGDTVHGKGGNLVTLVDRKSGYPSAYPVQRRTRRQVTRAIKIQLKGHQVHTLTLDNGKEFAGHERIALKSSCGVYFADPYASWQRGTNENTNGLLRQYFPRGSDFSKMTVAGVSKVAAKINIRPRKR